MNIRLINLAVVLQVLLSAVNQYFILSWAVRFTKATSSLKIKLMNPVVIHCAHCKTSRSVVHLRFGFVCTPSTFCLLRVWKRRRFHILQFVSACWTWRNTILVIEPILGPAGWEPQGSSPTHAGGRQIKSYHLLLVCPRDTPNIWCKFSHTSPDLLIRSGQVKKCFSSGERASGRKKSVVNSVYLKERHGAYCFSTLSCESYLRAALFGLNHSNRIVFFERVPRNLFVSDLNLKWYPFKKYTVLIAF